MADVKAEFKKLLADAVNEIIEEKNLDAPKTEAEKIVVQDSPNPEMGDIGSPMFMFAKSLHLAPQAIAQEAASKAAGKSSIGEVLAVGPYVNLKMDKTGETAKILKNIETQGENYGTLNADGNAPLAGHKIMIEFSAPNTNKPLHLGHLRNDALGESVSRILKKAGAEVFKVDLINNRGIHICKSMLAYKLFHEAKGDTPEKLGMKGDHFVGQCYVEFDKYLKGDAKNGVPAHPEALRQAEEMLIKWEQGDEETHKLWKMMNDWTIDGLKETYARTGVGFDKYYYESETYLKGKDEIQKGLEKGVFFKADDGSVRVDVTEAVGK